MRPWAGLLRRIARQHVSSGHAVLGRRVFVDVGRRRVIVTRSWRLFRHSKSRGQQLMIALKSATDNLILIYIFHSTARCNMRVVWSLQSC